MIYLGSIRKQSKIKIEFKEEQKFTQWWLWLILIGIGILPLLESSNNLCFKKNLEINQYLILTDSFMYVYFWANSHVLVCATDTEIDQHETNQLFPFVKKRIKWKK